MTARPTAAALTLALAWWAAPACAQPRPPESVRLAVFRDARSDVCPDADVLRALLLRRLHRDAVRDDASAAATIRFTRERGRFVATLTLRRAARTTTRRLRSAADDCARLGDAASLVLALAVDPVGALRPAATDGTTAATDGTTAATDGTTAATDGTTAEIPAQVVASTPQVVASTPQVAATTRTPAEIPARVAATARTPAEIPARVAANPLRPAATTLQLAALATLSTGTAPGPLDDALHVGLAARVAPISGAMAFPIELAVDAPGDLTDAARHARVAAFPVQLGAGVCRRFGRRVVVPLCATVAGAAVFAWGGGYGPDRTDVAFALGFGVRAGAEFPLGGRCSFVAAVDLRALALRPSIVVGGAAGATLWTAAPVAATLSVGVAWANH